MSEHVVAVRLQYDDAGLMAGMPRDIELTRQVQAAMKEGGAAVKQLSTEHQALAKILKADASAAEAVAKAQTAQTNTTRAQSAAATVAARAAEAESRATVAATQAAIADESASIKLATAKAKLEQQTASAAKSQAQLQETLRRNTAAAEETAAGVNSIGASLSSATTLVKAFIGAWVVRETITEAKKLVMEGVNFNAELEQTRIGSAAIITTFGKIYDAQGHLLKGAEAFNAAQTIGADLTDQIKNKTLQTTLLFSQMQDATRRSLAYELQYLTDAKGKVASNKDLASFTSSFAQGAVTFGLGAEEIPNNLRGLLTGTGSVLHSRFAAALLSEFGTKEQAREQMQTWHDQGVLIQNLQKLLDAFALAGEKSMNTYTGAVSNLHDAWQQLLGEATSGTTGVLTQSVLELRDSLVTVDRQGHATFNAEFVSAIREAAEELSSMSKAGVATAEMLPSLLERTRAWWQLVKDADPTTTVDQKLQQEQDALTSKNMARGGVELSRYGLDHNIAAVNFGPNPGDSFQKKVGQARGELDDSQFDVFMKQLAASAHTAPMNDQFGRQLGSQRVIEYIDFLKARKEATKPKPLPFTLKGGKPADDETDTAAENKLADFQRFMEPFHVGAAGGTDGDPLAKALQQITVERLQAIDHYKKAHKELSDANEDWKRDLADINATFANRGDDAIAKYLTEFQSAREKISGKYSPAKQGEYEAQNVDAKLSALQELDDVKRKFPGIAAEWTSLENQIGDFYKKKLVDESAASLTKINDQTLQAVKKTSEIEEQIRIDANTETENRRIDQITNAVDRELATRIAANDRWAAEEDKRAQIELAGDTNKGLREQRLAVIEQGRIQKNRAAEEAAYHAQQAMIAGTEDWFNKLAKDRDEVIPKIGVTLHDTVLGALESTQSAIDKYFSSIADGNANLGASGDALVHDLGQKWSKVFSEAFSAPLHGGSILDSLKQIKGVFETGSGTDKFLAGAGIGSFIGGLFGPGNKAASGGAIGGGVGAAVGSYWGPIGAQIGSAIGGAIGSAIGATMKTSDHIAVSMRGLTLDSLRGPYTSILGENRTTQNLGLGSLDVEEKGISAQARADLIVQIHRKAEETMKSWQQVIDLFPDDVKAKLASFHPTLDLSGGTGETGNITDEGALGSLNDFLSNKLPKATFAAYEPALRAGLGAMGEGQNRIAQLMTYWGTMQGTELHDAVLSYITALTTFAKNKTKIGDFGNAGDLIPGSAQAEALKNEAANSLSQVTDIKGQMAGVLASLPKLSDVSDQLAAMEQLNSLSDSFFAGLVAGFQKIDEREKQTFASLDSFDEQVKLASMGDQDKLNYYYKRMGELENRLQTTKDPERVSELVSQIEQYGQQALGLAPTNAANRDELAKISAEVRALAGDDYNKGRNELVAQQKSAYELLNSASQNLLKASNDLIGRGAGSGRGDGSKAGDNGGGTGGGDPRNVPPIQNPDPDSGGSIGPQSIHDAFRLALDDKPIAIGTTSGVAMIVDSIDSLARGLGVDDMNVHAFGVSPSILDSSAGGVEWYRDQMNAIVEQLAAASDSKQASSSSADRSAEIVAAIKELAEEMRRTRTAIVDRAVVIQGDGADFLRSVGFSFQEMVFQTLKDHPEMAVHLFDVGR